MLKYYSDHLEYVLGVDIGTSSVKCCVTGVDGKPICVQSTEYIPVMIADGTVEQHPDIWYEALISTLNQVNICVDIHRISAVCLTGQMRGLTLIGHNQKPVANSILWNDTRCGEEVKTLRECNGEMLKRVTYNPINTMCTLPKILWLKKYHPELWKRTYKFLYPKDYINFRLTGRIATDHSDASGSSVYDFKLGGWSEQVIACFDLEADKFPEILNSFDIWGMVSAVAAAETGLREGIPVFTGGSDATVELYAIGVLDDTQCKIRLGSSCGISIVVKDEQWHTGLDHYCWKPVTGQDIVLDINTRFCAQSVKWLRDVFYSECPKTSDTFALIDREAATVPAGTEGLIYHPYLQGEDAPYWNTRLRGMFHGMNANHERRHFARAVLEGVALSIKDVMETYADIYRNCCNYMAVGGGSRSDIWMQIIVDALSQNAMVPKYGDAAYGACLIALKGLGKPEPTRQAVCIVKADPQSTRRYECNYEVYKAIVTNQL